ncbi:unnamed protein product, partial [Phaeothamnion confervicola]
SPSRGKVEAAEMKKLLTRVSIDESETQFDAVRRILALSPAEASILLNSPSPAVSTRACHGLVAAVDAGQVNAKDVTAMLLAALEPWRPPPAPPSPLRSPTASQALVSAVVRTQTRRLSISPAIGGGSKPSQAGLDGAPLPLSAVLDVDAALWPFLLQATGALLTEPPPPLFFSGMRNGRGSAAAAADAVAAWRTAVACQLLVPLAATVALDPRHAGLRPLLAQGLWSAVFAAATATAVTAAGRPGSITDVSGPGGNSSSGNAAIAALLAAQGELLRPCALRTPPLAAAAVQWSALLIHAAAYAPATVRAAAMAAVAPAAFALSRALVVASLPAAPALFPLASCPAAAAALAAAAAPADVTAAALRCDAYGDRLALFALLEALLAMPAASPGSGNDGRGDGSTRSGENDGTSGGGGDGGGSGASRRLQRSELFLWSLRAVVFPLVAMAGAGDEAAASLMPSLQGAILQAEAAVTAANRESGTVGTTYRGFGDGSDRGNTMAVARRAGAFPVASACWLLSDSALSEADLVGCCNALAAHFALLTRAGGLGGSEGSSGAGGKAVDEAGGRWRERATIKEDAADCEAALAAISPLLLRQRLHNRSGGGDAARSAALRAAVALEDLRPLAAVRLLPFLLHLLGDFRDVSPSETETAAATTAAASGQWALRLLRALPR